jgi:hypothetical protein
MYPAMKFNFESPEMRSLWLGVRVPIPIPSDDIYHVPQLEGYT